MISSTEIFKNKHAGKIGFVLGAGPSVRELGKPEILNKGITFACNASVCAIEHAEYFVYTDGAVSNYEYFDRAVDICDTFCICNPQQIGDYTYLQQRNKPAYLFNRRYHSLHDRDLSVKDGKLVLGLTVVPVAIHLAAICGCSPIVLIGVDLKWRDGQRYCIDWKDYKKKRDDLYYPDNTPGYFQTGCEDKYFGEARNDYRFLKDANPNVKILDASGGNLNIFKKIDVLHYFDNK